jgi:hypothetical protein
MPSSCRSLAYSSSRRNIIAVLLKCSASPRIQAGGFDKLIWCSQEYIFPIGEDVPRHGKTVGSVAFLVFVPRWSEAVGTSQGRNEYVVRLWVERLEQSLVV